MAAEVGKRARNQSIEVCRMVAAVMVVFIHMPLHEPYDEITACLARFSVPFFFMVSGYFSLGRDSGWVQRRLIAILKLNLYATIPYYLWGYIRSGWNEGVWMFLRRQVFREGVLMRWFLENTNPGAEHLWFLAAMVPCYLVLWLYCRFREGETQDHRGLYLTGVFLMCIHFVMSILLPANGLELPYQVYRNGWLMGIPVFLMGMFLHEHGGKLVEKFSLTTWKLGILTAAGILLSIMQWKTYGMAEMFLGTIPELVGLMLLLIAHPALPRPLAFLRKAVPGLGTVSTVLYVVHILVMEIYEMYILEWVAHRIYPWEPYAKPFLIAGISLVIGILWERMLSLAKGWSRRR